MPLTLGLDITELCNSYVDLMKLPDQQTSDSYGGPVETGDWSLEREHILCLIVDKGSMTQWRNDKEVNVTTVIIFFPDEIRCGNRHRLIYQDPLRGQRVFIPNETFDAAQSHEVWYVRAEEVT